MRIRSAAGAVVLVPVFAAGVWVGIGGASTEGSTAPTKLKASLTARQEVPAPTAVGTGAKGSFVSTLVRNGARGTLTWKLTFSGLTGKAVAAHVHYGARGKAGAVAVSLCGPCRSGVSGKSPVTAKTVKALEAGTAYVNVHTPKNPAGEIRGQIGGGSGGSAAPPPTTTTTTTQPDNPYPYP